MSEGVDHRCKRVRILDVIDHEPHTYKKDLRVECLECGCKLKLVDVFLVSIGADGCTIGGDFTSIMFVEDNKSRVTIRWPDCGFDVPATEIDDQMVGVLARWRESICNSMEEGRSEIDEIPKINLEIISTPINTIRRSFGEEK